MIELLVHAAPHNYSAALERSTHQAIPWYVRRARAYMHDHLADLHSITEVACSVGITPRTLQNGFRQVFNMTPAEYMRDIRIQALHTALLNADPTQSVTELMQNVGIVNFGRYAQYYRRKIGVTPSTTLRGGA
jgi:transcriptional regulator GlxA family with amidase domain